MPTARLSKRTADAALPSEKTYFVRDTDLAGFALRVTPTGAKACTVDYRPNSGGWKAPKRLMTLGSVYSSPLFFFADAAPPIRPTLEANALSNVK